MEVWLRSYFVLTVLCLCSVFAQTTLESETTPNPNSTEKKPEVSYPKPDIYFLHYDTFIKHRYARTVVSSRVTNPANISQEVHFGVVLPEKAFISRFVMIIKDKEYEAYVKEKEEAKADYEAAVQAGQTAAHVELSARDANRFQVSVNVEAGGKINFNLTYEELLTRTLGHYTHTLNVNPGQIVKDLAVKVRVEETAPITSFEVPDFKTKNEITADEKKDNALAKVVRNPDTPNVAEVTWSPTYTEQKEIAEDGLKGRLVIEYDIDRKEHPSQILVDEGYFVHFFAPTDLPSLQKQVVFVLDISGSMFGEKMKQLKDAMLKILTDLNTKDYFSIVLFSSDVHVWSPKKTAILSNMNNYSFYNPDNETKALLQSTDGEILQAVPENIDSAKKFVENIQATDATNIIGGLRRGLELVTRGQNSIGDSSSEKKDKPQPIIFFLTDGEPNVELSDPKEIVNETTRLNVLKTPIFSLAFGEGADYKFLQKLSLSNDGFARNIYEGSDAALQLNNLYKEISSPLLSNVSFTYLPGEVDNETLTVNKFPIFFRGTEIIIAGKTKSESEGSNNSTIHATFNADKLPEGVNSQQLSPVDFCYRSRCFPHPHPHPHPIPPIPTANRTIGHLEKLWAYLTIKQLLDKDSSTPSKSSGEGDSKDSNEKKEALKLALKYKFVTPLTSLVVVKPNETQAVDTEKASAGNRYGGFGGGAYGLAVAGPVAPVSFSAGFGGGFGGAPGYMSAMGMPQPQVPPPPPPPPGFYPSKVNNGPVYTTPYFPSYTQVPDVTDSGQNTTNLPTRVELQALQWLNTTLNDTSAEEPTIEILSGNYTVGLNQLDTLYENCTLPSGEQKQCRHLKFCSFSTFVDRVEDYTPYFCAINNHYAGVCCPFDLYFAPPPPPPASIA